jgi:hypothetical protein
MFYAGIEGRKFGLAKAVEDGLQGAIYNIVYPPGEDEASIEDFQFMVNTQSFRLPYEENTWSPKLADHLSKFGPIGPDELVEADADGVPQKLAPAGETLCDDLIELQDDYNATMLLAPYFFAASVDDAALEASLLCSQYVAEHWEGDVLAGVMLDASHLTNNAAFERLANRLTSPDAPSAYYFDFNTGRKPRRPLRNTGVLDSLKELFDVLRDAGKYSFLGRCDLEGLLLYAASGLDAFSIGYYHSDRQSLHGALVTEYEKPGFFRPPTPYVFSPSLLTDIPRDVAQVMMRTSRRNWLSCGCSACAELIRSSVGDGAASLCPAHFYVAITGLVQDLADADGAQARAEMMLDWLGTAEERAGDVVAPAGTFTHLGQWSKWLEEQSF